MNTPAADLQQVVIKCRPGLANGVLNGSKGLLIGHADCWGQEAAYVWLLSGPEAGRFWWFRNEDLAETTM